MIDRRQRFGLAANPSRHAGAAGRRRPEQVIQDLRGSFLGHELLGVEIDARRLDPLAILGRRNNAFGKSARVRWRQAGQSWTAARCSVTISGFSGRSKTWRFSSSTFESAGSRAWQCSHRSAACSTITSGSATWRSVSPRCPFWPPLRLPVRVRKLLQYPTLLPQPVARRRFRAVGAVQIQPSPKLGVLRSKRLDPAHQRVDKLHDFGRNNHPTLESEIDLLVPQNRKPASNHPPGVTFRTYPTLAANQRLRRAIMDENGGGAGRFIGAFATGDRARLIKLRWLATPIGSPARAA